MIRKILVIRFSSIGDIVLTSPVIRCLKKQIPETEIHFITKKAFAAIAENNPYIDKVFQIEHNVAEVLPALKAEKYDFIIDLHKNLRSFRVIIALKRPYSTFNKLNFRKWLLVRFRFAVMPSMHIVDRYLKTAEKLGISNDNQGLDFFIHSQNEIDLNNFPAPFNKGFVGVVIGGKHKTKILPVEKVVEICQKLNFPVMILGGVDDMANGEKIVAQSAVPVYNACGKFNLMQSASLIRQSMAVVTNDTGLMHIAAAFRKTIVSVWGNTVPELGMYPYLPEGTPQLISEVKGLACRPCSKIGFEQCPKGHFNCMMQQDTEKISSFINAQLKMEA